MATARYEIRELRFIIQPEMTHAFVLCGPTSDGTKGVQGWHHKAFPPSVSVSDILADDIARSAYLAGAGWSRLAPTEVSRDDE